MAFVDLVLNVFSLLKRVLYGAWLGGKMLRYDLARRLSGVLFFSPRFYCRCVFGVVCWISRGMAPEKALRFLFMLDEKMYSLQSSVAVQYNKGIHPKHDLIRYHNFFVSRLSPGETVLDIGCGNGFLAYDMAVCGEAIVMGIDLCAANIEMARKNFSHPRVTYICGDVAADLPEGMATTIVLSNVLEHLRRRAEFLCTVRERYSPKRFLVRVPLFERDWRVPMKKKLGLEWRLDPTHETEYTMESFIVEVKAAGLRFVHCEVRWGEIWCELVPVDALL